MGVGGLSCYHPPPNKRDYCRGAERGCTSKNRKIEEKWSEIMFWRRRQEKWAKIAVFGDFYLIFDEHFRQCLKILGFQHLPQKFSFVHV